MVNIKIITFNLDKREFDYQNRLKRFLTIIEDRTPDIVMIQEGTNMIYEKLFREMKIMGYKREVPPEIKMRTFGEIIFTKFDIIKHEYNQFQFTHQCRGLTKYLIKITQPITNNIDKNNVNNTNNEPINLWIATSQFEQGNRVSSIHNKQIDFLQGAFRMLKDPVIFAGDTNILEYCKDTKEPEGWLDAWLESGTRDTQYTLNCQKNMMTPPPFCDRVDRVWYKPTLDVNIDCTNFELVGTGDNILSSHFGVETTFSIENN